MSETTDRLPDPHRPDLVGEILDVLDGEGYVAVTPGGPSRGLIEVRSDEGVEPHFILSLESGPISSYETADCLMVGIYDGNGDLIESLGDGGRVFLHTGQAVGRDVLVDVVEIMRRADELAAGKRVGDEFSDLAKQRPTEIHVLIPAGTFGGVFSPDSDVTVRAGAKVRLQDGTVVGQVLAAEVIPQGVETVLLIDDPVDAKAFRLPIGQLSISDSIVESLSIVPPVEVEFFDDAEFEAWLGVDRYQEPGAAVDPAVLLIWANEEWRAGFRSVVNEQVGWAVLNGWDVETAKASFEPQPLATTWLMAEMKPTMEAMRDAVTELVGKVGRAIAAFTEEMGK